ncbi:site-specific integrase [Flagellimonas algicola]|uniref:Site-specific integrase n=1 Tax=Flagellimonas algicola TaxID=2583815 RepID=A0ABY2WJI9_9FLAO|nr:site-specific integrase [Allomuricauda algicola]TMU54810.1 site-specific integrase [Allomuricauda algicola]
MNKNAIKVLFLLAKNRPNKMGKCTLKCRITYHKKRREFSTGQFINPNHWNNRHQYVEPPEPDNEFINTQLNLIRTKINQVFLWLQVNEAHFTVEDIYRLYKGGKTQRQYNVIEFFERYLERLKTLVGIDIRLVTWNKHMYVKNDLECFIKWKFKTNDFPLKKIESNFLNELEYYFKTQQKIQQVTINKKIQRFRKVIKMAVAENYLDQDPFHSYKPKRVKKEIVFLTKEELKALEEYDFVQPRLEYVRDLFIFSCYTGLPYSETMSLRPQHIQTSFDRQLWIFVKRKKTSDKLSIPLLPQALRLIKKYRIENNSIFPRISNQKVNSYLKEIADIVGIEKRITHHTARKTFATTILLGNNVPMEIVSKVLGHSSIGITEKYYGKILNTVISKSFSLLLEINNEERE